MTTTPQQSNSNIPRKMERRESESVEGEWGWAQSSNLTPLTLADPPGYTTLSTTAAASRKPHALQEGGGTSSST